MSVAVLTSRPRRWLAIVLIASLAVNAFLLGAFATDLPAHLRLAPRTALAPVSFELRWLEGRLPPAAFARMQEAVADGRPDALVTSTACSELRLELGRLAAEPQPDRAAIDAQLAEIRAELGRMQAGVQERVMDALLALPPETRAKLAEKASTSPDGTRDFLGRAQRARGRSSRRKAPFGQWPSWAVQADKKTRGPPGK